MSRALLLIPAFMLFVLPLTVDAQGRSTGTRNGNGPAFCRNGQGHPAHGWEWCRERGWGNATNARARNRTTVSRQRDDRGSIRRVNNPGFDNGYADGYEKGLDDGGDRREFNPTRHAWYRSADRHYDSDYGSRAAYANVYRERFRSGYEQGYADGERYGDRGGTSRFPWPF